MEVPDLGHIPSRGGDEVGNTEAARSEHVSAGSRGDRAGTAARSVRTRVRCAVRPLFGVCAGSVGLGRSPAICSSSSGKNMSRAGQGRRLRVAVIGT
jgi:hypothetical protein